MWNCYSTNCNVRGVYRGVTATPSDSLVRTKPVEKALKPYKGSVVMLNGDQRLFLSERVGFQDRHNYKSGVKYAPMEDRFAFPIYSPTGNRRGWVLRSYDEWAKSKSLTMMDVDEPHLSWYGPWDPESSHALIVEDIPSAVRASMHVGPCVALCGGSVGPEYIRELSSYVLNVTWALDADATGRAIALASKYSFSFDSSRVLPLEKDLKDMTEQELRTTLQELKKP